MDLKNQEPHIQQLDNDSHVVDTKSSRNYGGTVNDTNDVDHKPKTSQPEVVAFSFFKAPKEQKFLLLSMGFVNFCAATCFSLLAPFYPKEAALKGASETMIGLVFGTFELVIFLTAPIFGTYITKIGAKFMFISGVMVCGVCAILFGLLDRSPDGDVFIVMCFLSRTVEALGASAYITASFAILSNEFPSHVATVIGYVESFSGLGMMVGPTIGSALYVAGGYEVPFFVMGSILIVCGVVSSLTMPKINDSGSHVTKSILNLLQSPLCVITAICIVFGAYCLGFLDPTLANHLSKLNLTTLQIGFMFLIAPGLYSITAPLFGWIGDTKKIPKTLVIVGNLFTGLSFLLLGPSPLFTFYPFELWSQIISLALLGLFLGCALIPTFRTLLEGAFQIGFEENFVTFGMVSGLFNSCFSLGAFLGPTGGGVLVDHLDFQWATTICAGFFALAGLLMLGYSLVEKYSDCLPQAPVLERTGYDNECDVNETSRLLPSTANVGV